MTTSSSSSTPPIPIRLLTHNIRFATTSPGNGELPWAQRKTMLLSELGFNTLYNEEAFICLQEVLDEQLRDVLGGLNGLNGGVNGTTGDGQQEWAHIGVGRNDGRRDGEYSPILFRPRIWDLQHFETIWLSETPDKPSKGWDAASIRILTIGVFEHRASKRRLVAMNTHLDDQGEVSRQESAKLILKMVEKYTAPNSTRNDSSTETPLPVFLTGDLNSEPSESAYGILTSNSSLVEDTKGLAKIKYADENSFTGFDPKQQAYLIDYVFVGPKRAKEMGTGIGIGKAKGKGKGFWDVRNYAVLENRFEDGKYNSDHRAVVADVVLL